MSSIQKKTVSPDRWFLIESWRTDLGRRLLRLYSLKKDKEATSNEGQRKEGIENLSKVLDPFFDSIPTKIKEWRKANEDEPREPPKATNPLVIACDKGQLCALLYICEYLEDLVRRKESIDWLGDATVCEALLIVLGRPYEKSLPEDNTALHHATTTDAALATIGKNQPSFLGCLGKIAIAQEQLVSKEARKQSRVFLELGSLGNAHNDTALMMAVANNVFRNENTTMVSSSALYFVKDWYSKVSTESSDEILEALTARNDEGESVLSLAASKGIVELVQWLVSIDEKSPDQRVIVTMESLDRCIGRKEAMERNWKRLVNHRSILPAQRERYESEKASMEECAALMKDCISRRAERMAQELLLSQDREEETSKKPRNGKRNKKKSKNHKSNRSRDQNTPMERPTMETNQPEKSMSLTPLENGKMGVRVPGQSMKALDSDEKGLSSLLPATGVRNKRTMSLDETHRLLLDRFQQGTYISNIANESLLANDKARESADSILGALCLDVNCLLYSAHGMALNLSPAQLDAVEQILKEQLQSVLKARAIQTRRYNQNTTDGVQFL